MKLSGYKEIVNKARARTLEILDVGNDELERGLELHKNSIVIDSLVPHGAWMYNETMLKKTKEMINVGIPGSEIDEKIKEMEDFEVVNDPETRMAYKDIWKLSGVTCISETVANHFTCDLYDAFKRSSHSEYKLNTLKDLLIKATCAEDIRRAKREEKHAILWNCQNTHGLAGGVDLDKDLEKINLFYALGFRIIQLTYNLRNAVGDGCLERYESGLSRFGLKFVERMNELNMLVDTSHCGYKTTLDAVEHSKTSVAATHTTCRAIHDHPRGKTDEEIKAIAEKGGYVGINMIPAFLGGTGDLNQFLDHIDYAADLIGVDRIGIGTDTGHREPRPKIPRERVWWTGFKPEHLELGPEMRADESSSGSTAWVNWPYYTVGLVSRGYSDQEIQKIIGGNFLRIIEKVIG